MVKPPWGCCSFIKFQKSVMNHFFSCVDFLGEPLRRHTRTVAPWCDLVRCVPSSRRAVRSSPASALRASAARPLPSLSRGTGRTYGAPRAALGV